MNLRPKVLLIVGLLVAASVLAMFVASEEVFTAAFAQLETRAAEENVKRALDALETEAGALSRLAADWATWDEAYVFAVDANDAFIESYFSDNTFQYTELNLLLVVNSSGQLVYGAAYDLQEDRPVPLPERLSQYLGPGKPLTTYTDTKADLKGLILLDQGPMLIASRPIVTSLGEGPIHGALLMGRYVDDKMVQALAETTHLSVWVRPVSRPASATVEVPQTSPAGQPLISIQRISEDTLSASSTLRSIDGDPILAMGVDLPRLIYAQGLTTIRSFLALIGVIGLALLTSFIVLLNQSVLSPVSKLSSNVQQIGSKGDLSTRVTVAGKDELSRLGGAINRMLAELDDRTRRLQELKSRFLSAAAHELKTPLVSIRGYADLIVSGRVGEVGDPVRRAGHVVARNAAAMQALVNDLLDIERIETGVIKLKKESVDMAALIGRVIEDVRPQVASKQQELTLKVLGPTTNVIADTLRVQEIVTNLLGNAVKFTPVHGSIDVILAEEAESLAVSVHDTGIGIGKEHLPEVFEPFTKIPKAIVVDSTGLGLSITKRLVEMHGGRIWAESAGEGKGATFSFTLPRNGGPRQEAVGSEPVARLSA